MNRIEYMKENLMNAVESQLNNLSAANAEELGAAVDMIKDLEEASYYCTITKAMEEKKNNSDSSMYYGRDMDRNSYNRMYYNGSNWGEPRYYYNNGSESPNYGSYDRRNYNNGSSNGRQDYREGRSGSSRRNYMESKASHNDHSKHMKDLEHYIQELSGDITEMIENASSEEKQMLQKKLSTLANRVYPSGENNNGQS